MSRLDQLNAALAELVQADDDAEPLEGFRLDTKILELALRHNLTVAEAQALRDACDGPIGGPFETYPC